MVIKVFLSTAISGISEEEIKDIYTFVDRTTRMEYDDLNEDDVIEILSNFDEGPAPVVIKHKKLHHLEMAFNKMKDCDVFFLLQENDGTTKPGCMVELNAWLTAGGNQPIIRRKLR